MASMKDTIFLISIIVAAFWIFFGFVAPLLSKIFIINSIEKRYKCKLDLYLPNAPIFFLNDYFRMIYPVSTIVYSYLLKKNKYIEKFPGLNAIHYKIENASRQEIFMSFFISITFIFTTILLFSLYGILKLYYGYK